MTPRRRKALPCQDVDPLDPRAARVAALDTLARRDHACAELRRKLLNKGFDPAIVGTTLEHLCEEHLVDDRRYVENFIGFRAARGQGPVRIRSDLRQLGLPADCVEEGLAAFTDWISFLQKSRQKKFGGAPPTDYAERQRQARFLAYRGYTGAQIRLALGFDTDIDVDT